MMIETEGTMEEEVTTEYEEIIQQTLQEITQEDTDEERNLQ